MTVDVSSETEDMPSSNDVEEDDDDDDAAPCCNCSGTTLSTGSSADNTIDWPNFRNRPPASGTSPRNWTEYVVL